jgi:hypothetical protein
MLRDGAVDFLGLARLVLGFDKIIQEFAEIALAGLLDVGGDVGKVRLAVRRGAGSDREKTRTEQSQLQFVFHGSRTPWNSHVCRWRTPPYLQQGLAGASAG